MSELYKNKTLSASWSDLGAIEADLDNVGFEPQRSNHFFLFIMDPTKIGSSYGLNVDLASTDSPSYHLTFSCLNVTLPSQEVGEIEIKWFNETRYVPGKMTVGDMEVTLYDYVNSKSLDMLYKWHNKIYNPYSGTTGFSKDYKSVGVLYQLDGRGRSTRAFYLRNIFPTRVGLGDRNYDSSDPVQITATFSIGFIYTEEDAPSDAKSIMQTGRDLVDTVRNKVEDALNK